jgi:hypothetical protein
MSDPALPAMDTIFKDFLKKKHVGLKKDVVLYVRGAWVKYQEEYPDGTKMTNGYFDDGWD